MVDPARPLGISPELYDYLVAHGTPPDATYEAIRADTRAEVPDAAGMQIGPDQYAFMRLLVTLVGVDLAVEVGTFTGSSSVAIAQGLRPGGRLVCCDVSEEWTSIARRHWRSAGLEDRIELRLGPAVDTLRALPEDEPVDFAFIDADKGGYVAYYEALVPRLRSGGVLLVDNVLWKGRVIDPHDQDDSTEAIRRFNAHARLDERVDRVMLPIGDGVTVFRKR